MDSGTLIVGVIILTACILPFVLMVRGRKKKEKKLLNSLTAIAENNHCKISLHELFEEIAIGLDEKANQLFFLRKTAENEIAQHINLADVKSCKVINTGHMNGNKEEGYKSIDKLDLFFSFIDRNKPDILLPIYNAEENAELSGEIQIIEKWDKIVNERIKPLQKK